MTYKGYVKVRATVEADSEQQARRKLADKIGERCLCTIEPCDIYFDTDDTDVLTFTVGRKTEEARRILNALAEPEKKKRTNGNIITEMVEQDGDFCIMTDVANSTVTIDVSLKWWNAEYKGSLSEPKREKGKWIEHQHEAGNNWEFSRYECSICHEWSSDDSDFCPNCGAAMRGANV